jgi:hypothetical protein
MPVCLCSLDASGEYILPPTGESGWGDTFYMPIQPSPEDEEAMAKIGVIQFFLILSFSAKFYLAVCGVVGCAM